MRDFWGAFDGGGLEVRRSKGGGARLSGSFKYNSRAVLSDGGRSGRPRKESFASRAFSYRIDRQEEDIHILVGHDFGKPLASRGAGTLDIRDTDDAVLIEAEITPTIADTSHGRDALALLEAGLAVGLSPGFRLPPKRAVARPERIEEEPNDPSRGMHRALIRTITAALLFEFSLVTKPAYPDAQVEMRNWTLTNVAVPPRVHATSRWRA